MIVASRSVHIHAPVERVFALMADPARRSRLNPHSQPLLAEIEGGGPLAVGSRCHYRVRLGKRVIDFRTEVKELEPFHRIIAIADTEVPFQVDLRVAADGDGARLTQTETFEPSEEMLEQAGTAWAPIAQAVYWLFSFIDSEPAPALRRHQERLLQHRIETQIASWLDAIKRDIEASTRNVSH